MNMEVTEEPSKNWYHLLYQAFVVDETSFGRRRPLYMPFTSGVSMPMVGDDSMDAMNTAYTNLPRPGTGGMPKEWSCDVERITVVCDRDVAKLDAFKQAQLAMTCDMKTVFGPRPLAGQMLVTAAPENMIHLPEMTPYWFEVLMPYGDDGKDLKDALPSGTFMAETGAIFKRAITQAPKGASEDAARRHREWLVGISTEIAKLTPRPHKTTFWVFIEGWGQRVVV